MNEKQLILANKYKGILNSIAHITDMLHVSDALIKMSLTSGKEEHLKECIDLLTVLTKQTIIEFENFNETYKL